MPAAAWIRTVVINTLNFYYKAAFAPISLSFANPRINDYAWCRSSTSLPTAYRLYTHFMTHLKSALDMVFTTLFGRFGGRKQCGLPFLYLGYWIRESPKMSYKSAFQPMQGLRQGRWTALNSD